MEEMRLQKYIAMAGICSRRQAEKLIEDGKVKVNGKKALLGDKITEKDEIQVNGKKINKIEDKEYYLLNKPLGYVCTAKEQFNRDKVTDIIKTNKRIVPVGRLDMYTTGALILTNDGELVNLLTHPRHNISKEYYVTIGGKITEEDLEKLMNGIDIGGYVTKQAYARVLNYYPEKNISRILVKIHEGKNRQVRKMFSELGYSVKALHRNSIEFLNVKKIKNGDYIKLDSKTIKRLYDLAK